MPEIDPRLARPVDPIVKVIDAACVIFDRPDLQKTEEFLTDFGMSCGSRSDESALFYAQAGYGPVFIARKAAKPAFRGLGLAVANLEDLQRLSALDGASDIEPAQGYVDGSQVRLVDPVGNEVRAIYGPAPNRPEVRKSLQQNLDDKRDRVNEGQRPPHGPSSVLRLGHIVLGAVEFVKTARWYMDTFGLIPSDIQTLDDGSPVLAFMRCDLGDTPADHHTVVISQNVVNMISHSAYEIIDLDDIAMGQEHLLSKGWEHAWGIGRHLLGSQIFDYWRDPYGDKVEHFCDSDKFTSDHPTGVSELTMSSIYQWGPPAPKDFEAPKMTPGFVWKALKNVRESDELTLARMSKLKKITDQKPRPWIK